MIDITSLVRMTMNAVKLAGASAPAFQQIGHQIADLIGPGRTQDDLKAALAEARTKSDQAHTGLQDAAKGK